MSEANQSSSEEIFLKSNSIQATWVGNKRTKNNKTITATVLSITMLSLVFFLQQFPLPLLRHCYWTKQVCFSNQPYLQVANRSNEQRYYILNCHEWDSVRLAVTRRWPNSFAAIFCQPYQRHPNCCCCTFFLCSPRMSDNLAPMHRHGCGGKKPCIVAYWSHHRKINSAVESHRNINNVKAF